MIQINNCPDLPPRDALGHKATFGKVCVVGGVWGDYPMIGAPALAARAALRSGCGLCVVAVPAPMLPTVLVMVPSVTGVALPIDAQQHLVAAKCLHILDPVLATTDALVVGPGLGCGTAQQEIVFRLVHIFTKPLIFDADALRLLAQIPDFAHTLKALKAPLILTPHPGEFDALAQALDLHLDAVSESTRDDAALTLAAQLGCVVVLKGPYTRVSDGVRIWKSPHAEAALAVGGSGDVLSGITGAFAAQFASKAAASPLDLFQVACLAVQVHALAAIAWSRSHGHAGLLPEDLANAIPATMAQLRGELE